MIIGHSEGTNIISVSNENYERIDEDATIFLRQIATSIEPYVVALLARFTISEKKTREKEIDYRRGWGKIHLRTITRKRYNHCI